MKFNEMVAKELARARSRYGDINTYHEGYAVILEELDEFWDQVRLWPRTHSATVMLRELVQLAAMAQRVAEDSNLLDTTGAG